MSNVQLAYETAGEDQPPLGKLTEKEERAAILKAVEELDPEDRAVIKALARELSARVRNLSPEGAIEFIAKTGMMIVKKNEAK